MEAAFTGTPTFISKNVGYANSFKDNGLVNFIVDFSKPKKAAKQIDKFKNKVYPTNFVKKLKKMHDQESVLKIFETIFNEIAYENSPTGIKSK